MAFNAKKKSGNAPSNRVAQANIEAGVYPARLVQLIDLGLQPQRPFAGTEKAPCQEIMLTYELVDEFMKDADGKDVLDKPRWISESLPFYGLFADKAKSTQRYYAFDPDESFDGDLAKAIEMPCNVTIVNNKKGDKVYDNIANIAAMRPKDAANCPALQNPSCVFDLETPDMAMYARLPKWIQEKICGNLNFKGSPLEAALASAESKPAEPAAKPAPVKKDRKPAPEPVGDDDSDDDNPY